MFDFIKFYYIIDLVKEWFTMKYNIVKEIRDMNLEFEDLKNLLIVLENMNVQDFKKVYERLKNPNNRDVFVELICKLIPYS